MTLLRGAVVLQAVELAEPLLVGEPLNHRYDAATNDDLLKALGERFVAREPTRPTGSARTTGSRDTFPVDG